MWWLVAWRHQAITWTNVYDLPPVRFSDVHLIANSLEISQPSVTKISLKNIFLRFYWNLPGANELKCNPRTRVTDWAHQFFSWNCSQVNATRHFWWEVTWWRDQMETFSTLLDLCAGNSPVTGEIPAQRPVTRSFDVFFVVRLNNGWVNNHEADDLRRHRAHHDVTVIMWMPPNILVRSQNWFRFSAVS